MKKEKICGVYKITNLINNKCYIGEAKNVYQRFWSHKNNASKDEPDRRSSPLLFEAIKEYRVENFSFEILEVLDPLISKVDAKARELHWMRIFNSYSDCCGYNLRRDDKTGMIVHEKTSEKIRARLKKEWESGVRSEHGAKLSETWKNSPERAEEQGRMFTKYLTKYTYELFTPEGEYIKTVLHKELCEMGLGNCLATFHQKKTNNIIFKGFKIIKNKL